MQDTHSHFHAYHACRVIVKHWNVNAGNVVHSCFGQEKTLCKKVLVVEWRVLSSSPSRYQQSSRLVPRVG